MAVGGRRLSRRSLLHAASAGLTTSGFLLIFNAIGGAVAAVPAAPAGAPTQPSGTGAQGLDPGAIAADAPLPALLPSDVAPTQAAIVGRDPAAGILAAGDDARSAPATRSTPTPPAWPRRRRRPRPEHPRT